MAHVTVHRALSTSSTCVCSLESTEVDVLDNPTFRKELIKQRSISECYFVVKGAALILPHDECRHVRKKSHSTGACVIQDHLKSMCYLLREEDTLRMAVKLETAHPGRTRYLVVVSYIGSQNTEECCLLGIDCNNQTTIGMVLPVWADTKITLDGDGGFSVSSSGRHHIFKPVSVQAMWSALQTLHKSSAKARGYNYFTGGGTHHWIEHYEKCISSDRSCLNEWHAMDDLVSKRPPSPDAVRTTPTEREATEKLIRTKLKEVMMCVDLDEVTSKYIRTSLEEQLDMNLNEYKSFIDQEMLVILGQMDAPTEIFEYLYLGSEWNASNLEELKVKGVDHILNVTREIDNFFPGMFDYLNVRVYDDEATELLKYWDKTYKYIRQIKDRGSKVLVHCKMGISRSASVVVAYVMKAYNWNLEQALDFVKNKRNCIKPNSGFIEQLKIYQGILDASKHRHNSLWRSKSETNLKSVGSNAKLRKGGGGNGLMEQKLDPNKRYNLYLSVPGLTQRPKSWSPSDAFLDTFIPRCHLPHNKGEEAVFEQEFKPLRQRSGTNPSCYLNLELGSAQLDPCRCLPDPLLCLTPKPSVPRVSSIKDRINELESQSTSTVVEVQRTPKIESKISTTPSTNKAGLVLNLAHQFEGGSKPNTPSPVEDCAIFEDLVSFKDSCLVQGVEPVVSQMKLPALKHQAILVKPNPQWPQSGEHELTNTTFINEDSKKPLTDSGLGEDETLRKSSHTVKDLYSRQSSGANSQTSDPFSWSRQSSCASSYGVPCSPPVQWYLRDRENDNTCHFYQDDSTNTCIKSISSEDNNPADARSVQHSLQTLVESQIISNCELISSSDALFTKGEFLYQKEDIPWTPGTVRRTKQKIEEKNLKRTTSYDSGFPGQSQSTPSTPPELSPDSDSGASVIRSQSLRNELRPRSMVFPSRWHPSPQPTNCSPRLQKSLQNDNPFVLGMPHSASTPSVVEAVNEVLCGTRVVLNSAIQSLPQYSADERLDKENSDSSNQTEYLLPKTAIQKESRLASKNTQEKSSEEKLPKKESATKELFNQSLISSQGDDAEGGCGVVKRLTKELEAKTGTVTQKKERIVIIGIDGKDTESTKKSSTAIKRDSNPLISASMPQSPSLNKRQQTLLTCENAKDSCIPLQEKCRTLSDISDDRPPVSASSPIVHHRKTSLDMDRFKNTVLLSTKVKDCPFVEQNRARPLSNGYQGPSISGSELSAPSSQASDTITSSCLLRSPTETGKPPTGSKSPFGVFNAPAPQVGTQKKAKKMQQGKSHPLSKLNTKQRHPNPVYNTM